MLIFFFAHTSVKTFIIYYHSNVIFLPHPLYPEKSYQRQERRHRTPMSPFLAFFEFELKRSQPELLFRENKILNLNDILHIKEPLTGSLVFFILVLNKKHPVAYEADFLSLSALNPLPRVIFTQYT